MGGANGFGGAGGSGYSGWTYLTTGGIGLPTGKAMYNGSQACLINSLNALVSGGVTTNLQVNGTGTGNFTCAAGSSPSYTGYVGCAGWLVQGGTTGFTVNHSGTMYFGRAGGGTTSDGHTSFAGTIGGAYGYADGPTAPGTPTLTLVGTGQVQVNFTASADNGGAAISAYRLFYWYTGEATDAHYVDISGSGYVLTGLTPGRTVNTRLAAKNAVSDAAGTVGVVGSSAALFIPSGGRIWDAASSTWKAASVQIWDAPNNVWKNGVAKIWDATSSSWKTAV